MYGKFFIKRAIDGCDSVVYGINDTNRDTNDTNIVIEHVTDNVIENVAEK